MPKGLETLNLAIEAGEINGKKFSVLDRKVQTGDTFLSAFNTGPHILTAIDISPEGWVYSEENGYPYHTCNCVPIKWD